MLFEFPQAQNNNINNTGEDKIGNPIIQNSAYYGGGQPVPKMNVGVDYTLGATYNMYAYKNWGNTSSYSRHYDNNPTEVTRAIVQPVGNVSPMYMHLSYDYPVKDSTKSYVWVSNFNRDNTAYYDEDDVRYLVLVYRTNAAYAEKSNGAGHAMRPFWAVDDANYAKAGDITKLNTTFGWAKSGTKTGILAGRDQHIAPSTDTWTYLVMDMKSNYVEDGAEVDFGIEANWSRIKARVAGIVGMSLTKRIDRRVVDGPRRIEIRFAHTQRNRILHFADNIKKFADARRFDAGDHRVEQFFVIDHSKKVPRSSALWSCSSMSISL
jgi:hypothetical protein